MIFFYISKTMWYHSLTFFFCFLLLLFFSQFFLLILMFLNMINPFFLFPIFYSLPLLFTLFCFLASVYMWDGISSSHIVIFLFSTITQPFSMKHHGTSNPIRMLLPLAPHPIPPVLPSSLPPSRPAQNVTWRGSEWGEPSWSLLKASLNTNHHHHYHYHCQLPHHPHH